MPAPLGDSAPGLTLQPAGAMLNLNFKFAGDPMKTVSLLEFRKNAEAVLRRVGRGESVVLTRRGRPAARLEPIVDEDGGADDPIYRLPELADKGGRALSNREMDQVIYDT